jgi:hypothetical protein
LDVKRYGNEGGSGSTAFYQRNTGYWGKGLQVQKNGLFGVSQCKKPKKVIKKVINFCEK